MSGLLLVSTKPQLIDIEVAVVTIVWQLNTY